MTADTRHSVIDRYNRNAALYDILDAPMEWMARKHRYRLFDDADGMHILEVGIGTGKNLPFYPPLAAVTAIEPSEAMRDRALVRARQLQVNNVHILHGDVQQLTFSDHTFDLVVDAFVFCSVADPVQGLREIHRVLRPGGRLRMIEHVRPSKPWLARLFDFLNPLFYKLLGANINRRTEDNIREAGFELLQSVPLHRPGIIRMFEAVK